MLPRLNCKRCEHTWIPRSDEVPTICPKCKSPYWNRERKNGENDNGEGVEEHVGDGFTK